MKDWVDPRQAGDIQEDRASQEEGCKVAIGDLAEEVS